MENEEVLVEETEMTEMTAEEEAAYEAHIVARYEEMISTEYYYALRGA